MIVILPCKKVSRWGESDHYVDGAYAAPNLGTDLSALPLSQRARVCAFAPCPSGTLAAHPSVRPALLLVADMHPTLFPPPLFLPVPIYLLSHRLSTYVPRACTVFKTDCVLSCGSCSQEGITERAHGRLQFV